MLSSKELKGDIRKVTPTLKNHASGSRDISGSFPFQKIILQSEDLPDNIFSLRIENCGSLGVTNALSSLHLKTITFKGIQELRIPSQAFLSGLRQLSSFILENTTVPLIPSFSFSSLAQVFEIQFRNVNIGSVSSDAFSDVSDLQNLKFVNSEITSFERHAFGRGTSKIANLILDGSDIGTINERAIWLSDSEIVHIDKCNINKVAINAISLDNTYFIYLTRSSVQKYEAGGIRGRFFSGVMIDNDYLNPTTAGSEPRPLFDLEESRQRGSSVAPFFHFTNNVLTKLLPDHAFFISSPTINIAVPNNTLGECSCQVYKNFLQSLRRILDDYTLNIHQALVEHGICLLDQQIFSIGCPDLTPNFEGPLKNVQIPRRELLQEIKAKSGDDEKATTTKPNDISKDLPGNTSEPLLLASSTKLVNKTKPTSAIPLTTKMPKPTAATILNTTPNSNASAIPSSAIQINSLRIISNNKNDSDDGTKDKTSVIEKPTISSEAVAPRKENSPVAIGQPVISTTILANNSQEDLSSVHNTPLPVKTKTATNFQIQPPQFSGKTAGLTDAKTVWNEIFGGIFSQRLRKPLPVSFPTSQPSVKFSNVMKPLELRKFQRGNKVVVSPR
ncbi:uncharacterized protein [Macrobrachium rosenbergii]|uniref:uncharacterized protein n=1 Tax=Macrobrachium rosenbergii TaxID=79674 RepID=UPI0034D68FB9